MKPSIACSAISQSCGSTRSAGFVADALFAADEQHRRGAERRHHHRIVARAGGKAEIGLADRGDGSGEEIHQSGVAGGGGEVVDLLDRDIDAAAVRDFADHGEDRLGRLVPPPGVQRTHVEGEIDAAGMTFGAPGDTVRRPTVATTSEAASRATLSAARTISAVAASASVRAASWSCRRGRPCR